MTTEQLNVGSGIYTISWKNSHDISGGYYDMRMEGRAVRLACVKYVQVRLLWCCYLGYVNCSGCRAVNYTRVQEICGEWTEMEWAGYGSAYVDVFIKMFHKNTERMRHFFCTRTYYSWIPSLIKKLWRRSTLELPGSKLGWETGYSLKLLFALLCSPDKYRDITSIRLRSLLPHLFPT